MQLTVQRQGERLEEKLAQLQLLENECVCFKAERDAAQQEAEQSRQILEEKSKALADNIGLLKQREARCIELEAQLSALTAQQVVRFSHTFCDPIGNICNGFAVLPGLIGGEAVVRKRAGGSASAVRARSSRH